MIHTPEGTCSCGIPANHGVLNHVEKRQVLELPDLKLKVIEYRCETRTCTCGLQHQGQFTAEVKTKVQYGSRVQGLASYLMNTQFMSLTRVQTYFLEVHKAELSQGSLINWQEKAFVTLAPVTQQIAQALIACDVGYADETGIHVNGKLQWWHTFSTRFLTHYHVSNKRGLKGLRSGGLLEFFTGVLIHDCWIAYFQLSCEHGLCNAHLLRELTRVFETTGQSWALELKTLLRTMKASVEADLIGTSCLSLETRLVLQAEFQTLVARGLLENPAAIRNVETVTKRGGVKQSFARCLLVRLRDHESSWLRFLFDDRVSFDNNLAERDVRMVKVREKVLGGSRGDGAVWFARIRGYISTLRKQGQGVYQALIQVFAGDLVLPASLVIPNTS